MISDNDFKTATMARLYSSQGHYEKASDIYKHILKAEPGRQDLVMALAEVEKKLRQQSKGGDEELANLFNKWMDLMLNYKKIQFLKKIKRKVKG
jgi:hypothetical protein